VTRGLRLRSGEQRFYERRVGVRFPTALSGYASFGYRGSFEVERRPCASDAVPERLKPHREEPRESLRRQVRAGGRGRGSADAEPRPEEEVG
jgi:hypothetical protein